MPLVTEAEIQDAYRGDDMASRYVDVRFRSEFQHLLHDRQVAATQRLLNVIGRGAALEIAPGPGRVTRDVRPSGKLVCLEYNEGMLAHGRAACGPGIEWVQGNAFELPFEPQFELVWTFRFIRHFLIEDRRRLYEQIRHVLNPGGYLLFDAVNERFSRPLREANPEEYPIYDELYRERDLRRELQDAGFGSIELVPVQKFHGLQSQCDILLGPRSTWLNRTFVRGLEMLPRRAGLEWIVTCRRE